MKADVLRPLLTGTILALTVFGLFRSAGHLLLVEGRVAANIQAVVGALLGLGLGWMLCRSFGGLKGIAIAVIPGMLLMAAITSHFGLVFPNLDPKLDKGFGGLMLWFFGFTLVGGVAFGHKNNIISGARP